MSLIDDLTALPRDDRPPKTCSVCWAFRDALGPERQAVNDALAAGPVNADLLRVLKANGYDVTDSSLRRHRRLEHQL